MITARQFSDQPSAVPAARHFVAGLLTGAPAALSQNVAVMVSELASNCIRHSASAFRVSVELTSDLVRIDVTDGGGGTPAIGSPPPSQPTGRGLQIVNSLADSWGVDQAPGSKGKTVWFTCGFPSRTRIDDLSSTTSS